MSQFWRLDGPVQTLLLSAEQERLPQVIYWGPPLPASEDCAALAAAHRGPPAVRPVATKAFRVAGVVLALAPVLALPATPWRAQRRSGAAPRLVAAPPPPAVRGRGRRKRGETKAFVGTL